MEKVENRSNNFIKFLEDYNKKDEDFREVTNHDGYLVDIINGKVWNKNLNRYLDVNPNAQTGYVSVGLWNNDDEQIRMGLHEAVIAAYYGVEPKSWRPYGLEVNHKDYDKSNNSIYNLELVTRQQQYDNKVRNKLKGLKPHLSKQEVAEILSAYHYYKGKNSIFCHKLAWVYDVHYITIHRIIKKNTIKYQYSNPHNQTVTFFCEG